MATMSQQPKVQPEMTVTGAPMTEKSNGVAANGPANISPGIGSKTKWKHSAFQCEDSNLCCYTHFLPCMAYSEERSRLKHLELNEKSPNCQFGVDAIIWCAGFWFCLYWIPQLMTRSRVRQRYNLEGSFCGDFWLILCCPCPAIMQEMEQISDEEKGLIQGHGDGELRVL